jgi:hypothetical protein
VDNIDVFVLKYQENYFHEKALETTEQIKKKKQGGRTPQHA